MLCAPREQCLKKDSKKWDYLSSGRAIKRNTSHVVSVNTITLQIQAGGDNLWKTWPSNRPKSHLPPPLSLPAPIPLQTNNQWNNEFTCTHKIVPMFYSFTANWGISMEGPLSFPLHWSSSPNHSPWLLLEKGKNSASTTRGQWEPDPGPLAFAQLPFPPILKRLQGGKKQVNCLGHCVGTVVVRVAIQLKPPPMWAEKRFGECR